MSDLEKKETAYSKTIQEADTIMARWAISVIVNTFDMTIIIITPLWPGEQYIDMSIIIKADVNTINMTIIIVTPPWPGWS